MKVLNVSLMNADEACTCTTDVTHIEGHRVIFNTHKDTCQGTI